MPTIDVNIINNNDVKNLDNTKVFWLTGNVNIKYPSSSKRLLLNLCTIRSIVNTIAATNNAKTTKNPTKYNTENHVHNYQSL